MKKTLIASAITATLLMGAAQAETVLYGSIRYDYTNSKNEIGSSIRDNFKDRTSNFSDVGSRIGLKGGEDLGNGIQIVYHLEWGFDGMEGGNSGSGFENRLAYVGLATEFGTVVAGRLDNPFKQTVVDGSVADDFNSFGDMGSMRAVVSQFVGGVYGSYGEVDVDNLWNSHAHGISNALGEYDGMGFGLDRVSNAIAYLSPNWNGFSFNAAMIMDNDSALYTNKKHADIFTFNAAYEHESGLYGKIGYIQGYTVGNVIHKLPTYGNTVTEGMSSTLGNINRKTTAWGTQLGFRTDQFGVSASYTDAKLSSVNYTDGDYVVSRKDKATGWDIGASYSFGDNYASTVRIAYGETRYTGEDHANLDHALIQGSAHNIMKPKDKIWAIGFEQKLSERTRVWAEYQQMKQSGNHTRYEAATGAELSYNRHGFNAKKDTFAIGIRHDF